MCIRDRSHIEWGRSTIGQQQTAMVHHVWGVTTGHSHKRVFGSQTVGHKTTHCWDHKMNGSRHSTRVDHESNTANLSSTFVACSTDFNPKTLIWLYLRLHNRKNSRADGVDYLVIRILEWWNKLVVVWSHSHSCSCGSQTTHFVFPTLEFWSPDHIHSH